MARLYQKIATLLSAWEKYCNKAWYDEHVIALDRIAETRLPSGSGIDKGCTIDLDASRADRIVLLSSYHTMDENGFYGRWIDFTVVITPSLVHGFNIDIRGKFGKDQDLKDYLANVFHDTLDEEE